LDTSSIGDIVTIANFVMDHVETNVPLNEIMSIGLELFTGSRPIIEEFRIPVNGSFRHGRYYGANILTIDFNSNITALHEHIYGETVDEAVRETPPKVALSQIKQPNESIRQ
jgi:anionic cell wall polymer biosynthesis LytR-Cps2A-Psr (LCP) family protein